MSMRYPTPTTKPIPFTLQQTLDTVVAHLLAGGIRSTSLAGSCRYRGKGGAKCFFGLMLPDDIADRHEGDFAHAVIFREWGHHDASIGEAYNKLQKIHDDLFHWHSGGPVFNGAGWAALRHWAKKRDLKWPEGASHHE